MMKIAQVVRDLKGKGGIQNFARTTHAGLAARMSSTLISWWTPLSIPQELIVRAVPTPVGRWLYHRWFRQDASAVLEQGSYDIVHIWHVKTAMAIVDTITAPYVLTCHGSEVLRSCVAPYQYDTFIRALNGAAAITTPSAFTKAYMIREYGIPAAKISIVHPGIDYVSFQQAAPRPDAIPTIGTLTRLVKRKNVLRIIEALQILDKRGVVFRYRLAGVGFRRLTWLIMRKLKQSSFTWEYLGKISDEQKLSSFYPSLDVFVLPSLERKGDIEGFGIVYLEANANGVPVIAANTGGVADAVHAGKTGEFADPLSAEDIADKIEMVLKHRQRYVAEARRWAQQHTHQATAEAFTAVYTKVLL
jgi:glycosyltransferase involved in cell wall biosynthesis